MPQFFSFFKTKSTTLDSLVEKSTTLINGIEPELLKYLRYYHIFLYFNEVLISKVTNGNRNNTFMCIQELIKMDYNQINQINRIEFDDKITEITIGTNAIKIPQIPYSPIIIETYGDDKSTTSIRNIHIHIYNLLLDGIIKYRQQYSSTLDITNKNNLKTEITALIDEMKRLTIGKEEDKKVLKVVDISSILKYFVKALDMISADFIFNKINYEIIPTPQSASIIDTPISITIENIEEKLKGFLKLEAQYNGEIETYLRVNKTPILFILNTYINNIQRMDVPESQRKVLGLLLKYEHILKEKTGGTGGNSNTKPMKTTKKQILGKERCIYKKTGDRKEYVKHKGNLITVKDYRTLMKKKASSTI
jgi:hypothetical protein